MYFFQCLGAELVDSVLDVVRKEAEACDCLQGFQVGPIFIFIVFIFPSDEISVIIKSVSKCGLDETFDYVIVLKKLKFVVDPLARWWHRIRHGNSPHFQDPWRISGSDHEHLLSRPIAKGNVIDVEKFGGKKRQEWES